MPTQKTLREIIKGILYEHFGVIEDISQATDQILQAIDEMLPKEEEIKDEDIKSIGADECNLLQSMEIGRKISKKLGFNACLAQIRERINE